MKADVLIIGGSAAGLVAGLTIKSNNPDKKVVMIRREEKVMIPCGIPYIFGTLGTSDKNILPDQGLLDLGVDIIVDNVSGINKETKVATTDNNGDFEYDQLVLATGSKPIIPNWLKGVDLDNVYTIPKNKIYLDELHQKLNGKKNITIIGAGFIGVETADELNQSGYNVTLIEILPRILGTAFDEEFAKDAEEKLIERGVHVLTDLGVEEIIGDQQVTGVKLNNGSVLDSDAVILSLGYTPNTRLATEIDLDMNEFGFIKTDQYKRTSEKNIFAAGDCSEKRDFSTGKLSKIMLASTACTEARVAGLNINDLCTVNTFKGTIGIYSTSIGEHSYGVAGLTEKNAKTEGFNIISGSFTGVDTHPGCLAHTKPQTVKLVVSKNNGVIVGGEAMGGRSVGELINVIGFAIQNGMSINDLLVTQIGTQPMMTASPAGYPLIKAAEVVAKKL